MKKTILQRLFAETRWDKYLLWLLSIVCLIGASYANGFHLIETVRDGLFHSGLLFGIAGTLSDVRYRLIPESRND